MSASWKFNIDSFDYNNLLNIKFY